MLDIPAPYAEKLDRQQLQLKAVEQDIKAGLEQTDTDQQLLVRRQTVLERLYTEQALSPDLTAVKLEVMADNTAADDKEPSVDLLAYNSKLKSRLVANKVISEADLNNLAKARQQAVMLYLQEQAKLSEAQLHAGMVKEEQAEQDVVIMKFDIRAQ